MVDYPKDWEEVRVKNFGTIVTGSTPSTNVAEYWGRNFTWITPTDINKRIFLNSSERKLTNSGYNVSRKLKSGTVLVTCIASIGKNCILEGEGSCNQQINAITVNKENNNIFIYYLMEYNKNTLESLAGITATKILKKKIFEEIIFFVPPLNEQKAIANTLMTIDKHIENLEKLIEKKKMIRDGAIEDLMSGKKRLDGFDGEWEEKSINYLTNILTGLTYKPEDIRSTGVLVLRSSNIKDNKLVFNDNIFVQEEKCNSEKVIKGDIIMCVRNGSSSLIGKTAYVNKKINATFGAFMSNIRCNSFIKSKFIYYYFKTQNFREKVDRILGATINQITKSDLRKISIIYPKDTKEQEAIASILTSMDEEIENLEREKEKIEKIKQGAMDDLLTGKVRLI